MIISSQSHADRSRRASLSEAEKIREKSSIIYAGTLHTDNGGTLAQIFCPEFYIFPTELIHIIASQLIVTGVRSPIWN